MPYSFDLEEQVRPGEQTNWTTALLACLFSLVAHTVMVYELWRMPMPWAGAVAVEQDARWLIPVNVEQVRRHDIPAPDRPGEGSGGITALSGYSGIEETMETLAVPADTSRMTPPPLKEEAVAEITRRQPTGTAVSFARTRTAWQPRQEILAVERDKVQRELSGFERRVIPSIERVRNAPDIVPPVDLSSLANPDLVGRSTAVQPPGPAAIARNAAGAILPSRGGLLTEPGTVAGIGQVSELPGSVAPAKPVEAFLAASVETYRTLRDPRHTYFRVEVRRMGPEILPVIPRDIVFVQDCSASMSEDRLHFCKEGMKRAVTMVGPGDRFNVVGFKETAELCFPDWVQPNDANRTRAEAFVEGLKSGGNTDIYTSIKELLRLARNPGRPIVVILVTDGRSTTGMINSSAIIGEFTKQNKEQLSVFGIGTIQTANAYLLDLLSFCNRGDSAVVTSGRWDIPAVLAKVVQETGRPVLSEVKFQFAGELRDEVFPVLTTHLYLDRPLVLYGRCRSGTDRLVFRATGRSGDTTCDMVFDLDLAKATKAEEKDIRKRWAEQKIYSLIGENARDPNPALIEEVRRTARSYGVDVPYGGQF